MQPANDNAANPPALRILLVTTGLKVGGAEQQVCALARAFVNLGQTVAILSLTSGLEVDLPESVAVEELDMRKTPLSMLVALRHARAFVHYWKPEIVHAHMVHANLFARMLTRFADMPPVICTAHSAREGGLIRALAYRVTDRWCAQTTHVSIEGRLAMIASGAVSACRVSVMPNGIDTARFGPAPDIRTQVRRQLGLSQEHIVLLNVGRLVTEKNQRLLIEAFADVHALDKRTRLLIAGDGPMRASLQALVRSQGLDAVTKLLGTRADIPDLLRAADVFVLSSSIEGMPLVIGEALASGLPIVATAAAGVRELAGDHAIIVPVGMRSELGTAMRAAVSRLPGTTPDEVNNRLACVRERFDVEGVARAWLARYRQLTEPH